MPNRGRPIAKEYRVRKLHYEIALSSLSAPTVEWDFVHSFFFIEA